VLATAAGAPTTGAPKIEVAIMAMIGRINLCVFILDFLFDLMFQKILKRAAHLLPIAVGEEFFDSLFDSFTGFACAFLNPANDFFLFAFGVLKIVIRQLGPFLFELALGDIPVAFDFERCHNLLVLFLR
jgi:hypothetical protein